ncbi:MAG: hypothetical protein HQL30_10080 [Candidatus Omnitrophica bacterium]|nr:hypothetical protein [Candidatus Omnitrophota bacterium]
MKNMTKLKNMIITTVVLTQALPLNASSEILREVKPVVLPNINDFIIPKTLGTVRTKNEGINGKLIIHINNTGGDYNSQYAINLLLEYLTKAYNINLVSVEGGVGSYDMSLFSEIKDSSLKKHLSEYLLLSGKVNGPEFFSINNPDKVKLFGVEKEEDYLYNLEHLNDALEKQKDMESAVAAIFNRLEGVKTRVYSEKMKEINAKKAGGSDIKDYLVYLYENDPAGRGFRENAVPNTVLGKITALFKGDKDKMKRERNDLLFKIMENAYSERDRNAMLAQAVDFNAGKIGEREFLEYIIDKAAGTGTRIREYAELTERLDALRAFGALDGREFYPETRDAEIALLGGMAGKDELELVGLENDLGLLEKMITFSLTRSEFDYYVGMRGNLGFRKKLHAFAEKYPGDFGDADINPALEMLDNYIGTVSQLYLSTGKRDETFVMNIENKLSAEHSGSTILITGKYHSGNLSELFRDKGYTYIEIMPSLCGLETSGSGASGLQTARVPGNSGISTLAAGSLFSEMNMPARDGLKEEIAPLLEYCKAGSLYRTKDVMDTLTGLFVVDSAVSVIKGYSWHETVIFITSGMGELLDYLEKFTAKNSGKESELDRIGRKKYDAGIILKSMTNEEKKEFTGIFMKYISSKKFIGEVKDSMTKVILKMEDLIRSGVTSVDPFAIELNVVFESDSLGKEDKASAEKLLRSIEYRLFLDEARKKAESGK